MDSAHNGQAVLHPVICNGVAAHQTASGLSHLLRAPLQDASQNVQIHLVRKADDVQRSPDVAAHGVDVAQGIGCGDLAENVGVLHHGREEIQRLNDRHIRRQAVDRAVVPTVKAHQQFRVARSLRKLFQHPLQHAGAQLGGASAAPTEYDRF